MSMHYYPFNVSDYRKDTNHLTPSEHYIYRQLIDTYYLDEKPIPLDTKPLLRLLSLSADQERDLANVLADFFIKESDGYHQKRIDEEIKKYQQMKKTAVKAGKASGKARRDKGIERSLNGRSNTVERKRTNPEPTKNQELRTKNQEPVTKNDELRAKELRTTVDQENKTIVELKHDPAQDVFKFWQQTMKHPKAAYDEKRKALIRKQLKHYSAEDLKKAIHGCSLTPHNMGDNDRGERFDSIELILREAKQIDRFIHNADNPPAGKITTIQQTQDRALAQANRIKKHLGWEE